MSLAGRIFVCFFTALMLLLLGSFSAVDSTVFSTLREGLRSSLREHQTSIARMRANDEQRNRRSLRAVTENPALKAGLHLMLIDRDSTDARLTVEDQLREMCETIGFDFLLLSDLQGNVLSGIMRAGSVFEPVDVSRMKATRPGLLWHEGNIYQVTSVPVDQGDERIAVLSVGEYFNLADLNTPAVLMRNGVVLTSTFPAISQKELQTALAGCTHTAECEVRLRGRTYLSLAMEDGNSEDRYVLRSLLNLDAAMAPVHAVLRGTFGMAGAGALAAAVILTAFLSRYIAKPIARVVERLRRSESTGVLPRFDTEVSSVREVRELAESFNRAGNAIIEGQERLCHAYVEFVGSLASALDARDCYTAGHSRRVSEFSCKVAVALQLASDELEELRIGALLHDVGKIGVPDSVLQKPGKLTAEEFRLIQLHPEIGRKILQDVNGFAPYLDTVELHHENWDGTGYPHGLRGEETPLAARIVHVADAYDAMTSDRPYRRGMSGAQAVRILESNAGTQFDPAIVEVFSRLARAGEIEPMCDSTGRASIDLLAAAVGRDAAVTPETVGTKQS